MGDNETPRITIHQLMRDDNDVVVYDDHTTLEEIRIPDDHYLVEVPHDLYIWLINSMAKVGEVAVLQVLRALGDRDLQVAKIELTRKAETITVRPVRRG